MSKIRIGITGASGFIGRHLGGKITVRANLEQVPFSRDLFSDPQKMRDFASSCDAIIHLAAISRHEDGKFLYDTNVALTQSIADAVNDLENPPLVYLGSTTHIDRDLPYHASKRESQRILENSRAENITLLMPNVFGPYSRPFFNSVVSTFCRIAADGGKPEKIDPAELNLIYIDTLCNHILNMVICNYELKEIIFNRKDCIIEFPDEHTVLLPELWTLLEKFSNGVLPDSANKFELQLWTTFRSYCTK